MEPLQLFNLVLAASFFGCCAAIVIAILLARVHRSESRGLDAHGLVYLGVAFIGGLVLIAFFTSGISL